MVLADIRSGRAFTLVELAIVIVIVGLLAGGIIAGKSLIHSSELRSVTADYSKFIAAENMMQRHGLPGIRVSRESCGNAAEIFITGLSIRFNQANAGITGAQVATYLILKFCPGLWRVPTGSPRKWHKGCVLIWSNVALHGKS